MMSKTRLILIVIIGLGLLVLGVKQANDWREGLKKAEAQVDKLTNTIEQTSRVSKTAEQSQ